MILMSESFNNAIATTVNQNRYRTSLTPQEEYQFVQWVKANKIPFDPLGRDASPLSDYDMRGFWKAMMSGDPNAKRAENLHFPDTYKTPFHRSFSNESIYAGKDSPRWEGNRLVDKFGKVVFDEDKH